MKKSHQYNGHSTDMHIFVRCVELGGFVYVADEMGLSASAVSKAISRLEERLEVQLFVRTTRSISMTAEGALFLEHAKTILELISFAESDVRTKNKKPSGELKVTIGTAYAKHQLLPRLPAFLSQYPDITVDLNITDHDVDLGARTHDIAIKPSYEKESGFTNVLLGSAKRHICASPDYLNTNGYPTSPEELTSHNCLTMNVSDHFLKWPFEIDGVSRDVEVGGAVRVDNSDMLLDLALQGYGIVRLLDTSVGKPLMEGRLISILQDTHRSDSISMWASVRKGMGGVPKIASFLEFFKGQ